MPGVAIVHLTDDTSPQVRGTDGVRRLPNGPMLGVRLQHYAHPAGEWLLVDTDVLLRGDVRAIFDRRFDVALTDRHWPHLGPGVDTTVMPYNTGVVFSRSAAFWRAVLEQWRAYPEAERDWLSEQRAVADVVRTGAFAIEVLPGATYNYPPDPDARDLAFRDRALVWHCKGPRKTLMGRLAAEVAASACR